MRLDLDLMYLLRPNPGLYTVLHHPVLQGYLLELSHKSQNLLSKIYTHWMVNLKGEVKHKKHEEKTFKINTKHTNHVKSKMEQSSSHQWQH